MSPGTVFHESNGRPYGLNEQSNADGEECPGYRVGDIVGVMIHLPELKSKNSGLMPDRDSDELRDAIQQWQQQHKENNNVTSSGSSGSQRRNSTSASSSRRPSQQQQQRRPIADVLAAVEQCEPLPAMWTPDMITYLPVRYPLPRPRLPGSWIRFFVNGVDQGVAFKDLFYGE